MSELRELLKLTESVNEANEWIFSEPKLKFLYRFIEIIIDSAYTGMLLYYKLVSSYNIILACYFLICCVCIVKKVHNLYRDYNVFLKFQRSINERYYNDNDNEIE